MPDGAGFCEAMVRYMSARSLFSELKIMPMRQVYSWSYSRYYKTSVDAWQGSGLSHVC